MSLTVKHLNSDASFLLTFRPLLPFPPSERDTNAFTILLDPWLSGPSLVLHPKFSISRHKIPSCVTSLAELPEPDVVLVSQEKSDHCHKETLSQLPPREGKTIILAEPAAAKIIKGWKHFEGEKLRVLSKWDEHKPETVHRIPIPPLGPEGDPGEVTICFLPQKGDYTGLHGAIGITYRQPSFTKPFTSQPITPPDTPGSTASFMSPGADRALSVIFSPHGCSYKTLHPYATTHLVYEAALPLTALLHCFDKVNNTWWLGGNICAGLPGGVEIAQNLLAKAWISAHDGDKDSRGFANHRIKVEKFDRDDVEKVVSPKSPNFPFQRDKLATEVVALRVGEEIFLSATVVSLYDDDSDRRTFGSLSSSSAS
jgi:hypothetical protein